MRIAVLGGCGAVGGVFGGLLREGGHDVVLVDVLEESVKRVNAEGLRIDTPGGHRHVKVRATSNPSDLSVVDLVLVLVKGYATERAVTQFLALRGEETTYLTIQNGWGNTDSISRAVGPEAVIAGATYQSATLIGPGHVLHAGPAETVIGELGGGAISPRVRRVADALTASQLDTVVVPDVIPVVWQKLVLNATTLAVSSLCRLKAGELLEYEPALRVMEAALREAIAVARARGIEIDFDERLDRIRRLLSGAPTSKPSMLQDVERGRRTEIDTINGAILREGERLGIETPTHGILFHLIKTLDQVAAMRQGG